MPRILTDDNDDDAQAMDVAGMVHQLFSGFDAAVRRHRLFKVRRGRVVARRQSRPSLYGDTAFLRGLALPETGTRMADRCFLRGRLLRGTACGGEGACGDSCLS